MRIESPVHAMPSSTKSLVSAPPSSFWQTIAAVKRAVSNFFRWILSFCLPISPRAPVRKEEIDSKETRLGGSVIRHQVVLHGRATRNAVNYKKVGEHLHLEELSFPDSEIYDHAPNILQNLLRKEKAKGFTTHYLETAKILNGCGFVSESTISFNAYGEGKTNVAIKEVINAAKAKPKRDRLGEEYVMPLKRIEDELLYSVGARVDSVIGSFTNVGLRLIKIQLSDLLMLMDAVQFTNTKGLSLGPDNDVIFSPMKS